MTTNRMAAGHLDGGDWVSRYLAANPPIPGWFSDEDVWLFSILDQLQVAAGVGRFTRDRRLPGQERSSSRLHAPTRRNSCCGGSLGQQRIFRRRRMPASKRGCTPTSPSTGSRRIFRDFTRGFPI